MNFYVKIPKNMLNENKNKTVDEQKVRLFLYLYLNFHDNYLGCVGTSFEKILCATGMSKLKYLSKMKKNARYKLLIRTLYELQDEGVLELPNKKLEDIAPNEYFEICYLQGYLDIGGYKSDGTPLVESAFIIFTENEYRTLIIDNDDTNKLSDLLVYVAVKGHIRIRSKHQSAREFPMAWALSQTLLAKETGLSINTVRKSLDSLTDTLNMLVCEKPKNIMRDNMRGEIRDGEYFNLKTVYALKSGHYIDELRFGVEKYKNSCAS